MTVHGKRTVSGILVVLVLLAGWQSLRADGGPQGRPVGSSGLASLRPADDGAGDSAGRDDRTDGSELPGEEFYAYLPLVSKPPPIANGDFEWGPVAWGQYSSNGWMLIFDSGLLLVPPHSGSWAAWLGGDFNEEAVLWQVVKVPTNNAILRYWLWIASADDCGYDVAGVAINLDEVVDGFWLCDENDTGGWVERTVDLSLYAGQTVELEFVAFTDDTLNSNLFIDDVSLGNAANDTGPAGRSVYREPGIFAASKPPRAMRQTPDHRGDAFSYELPEIRRGMSALLSEG